MKSVSITLEQLAEEQAFVATCCMQRKFICGNKFYENPELLNIY